MLIVVSEDVFDAQSVVLVLLLEHEVHAKRTRRRHPCVEYEPRLIGTATQRAVCRRHGGYRSGALGRHRPVDLSASDWRASGGGCGWLAPDYT